MVNSWRYLSFYMVRNTIFTSHVNFLYYQIEDPEFWDLYCDTVDDCPVEWLCDGRFRVCYAPSYIPSYFKDLGAPKPRDIVNYKQR